MKEKDKKRVNAYRKRRLITSICKDCLKEYYVYRDNHYVFELCPECLETTPMMDNEGDHRTGKKDHRAALRANGMEGDDYFG